MCERGRGGSARVRRVCMCALLTTTHVAPSIHSTVWGLNVHVCVCMYASMCVPSCLNACLNASLFASLTTLPLYGPFNAHVCVSLAVSSLSI